VECGYRLSVHDSSSMGYVSYAVIQEETSSELTEMERREQEDGLDREGDGIGCEG
jgi:hypothetical protein